MCFVIGEQQPAVAADDEHAFPHGMQHRVVVLVHTGHLQRPETVRLAAQPPAHQRGTARGDEQHRPGGAEQQRELVLDDSADMLDGDSGGDQPDNLAVAADDRDDGLNERPDGPDDLLGSDLTGERGLQIADELLADPVGQRVRVADPVGVEYDDEVDPGAYPGLFGARLQHEGRVGSLERCFDTRRMGEGLGDGDGPVLGLALRVGPGLQHQRHHGGRDQQHHDRQLQEKDLTCDSSHSQNRARAAVASGHVLFLHLPPTVSYLRTVERGGRMRDVFATDSVTGTTESLWSHGRRKGLGGMIRTCSGRAQGELSGVRTGSAPSP